ncbi:MAG: FecR family protein [Myxococcota bacterium]
MSSDFEYVEDLQRLATANQPTPDEVDAARARLRRGLRRPKRGRTDLAVGVAVALAATALITVAVSRSGPSTHTVSFGEEGPVALTPNVNAVAEGEGEAVVRGEVTEVTWSSGRIRVDVEPDTGQTVRVTTPEAEVTVLGTIFDVERGPFGTRTSVERGRVSVTCVDQSDPMVLSAGTDGWCYPDAGAAFGRVLWMERQDYAVAERLAVIEQALAHPQGLDATRTLLRQRQVAAYVELNRTSDAVAAVKQLPPRTRAAELAGRAESAMASGGCTTAEPWLDALAEDGDVTGALLLVQCLAEEAPDAALRELEALEARELTAEEAAAVRAWRRALGE